MHVVTRRSRDSITYENQIFKEITMKRIEILLYNNSLKTVNLNQRLSVNRDSYHVGTKSSRSCNNLIRVVKKKITDNFSIIQKKGKKLMKYFTALVKNIVTFLLLLLLTIKLMEIGFPSELT